MSPTFPALACAALAVLLPQCVPTPAEIRTLEVAGHDVRARVAGLERRVVGEPVVVLEAGMGNSFEVWEHVLPLLEDVPTVAYDRAGLGGSEWDGVAPEPKHVATRLRALLAALEVEPPFLLLGYSWGGALVRGFAGEFPAEVAGVVYVDPRPIVTDTRAEDLRPFEAVGAGEEERRALWDVLARQKIGTPPAVLAEFEVARALMEREPAERGFARVPAVPVAVVVAARPTPFVTVRDLSFARPAFHEALLEHKVQAFSRWALESPRGTMLVTNHSDHDVPHQDPESIAWAVRRVLAEVRAGAARDK